MNGSIYKITNLINQKCYIGQSIQEPIRKRWNKHLYMARQGHTFPLYNAIRKYGAENFKFELIDTGIQDIGELNNKEESNIILYNSTDRKFGYNLASKAMGKGSMAESSKEKLRLANIGKVVSYETRKKLSLANSGENNPNFGKLGVQSPRYGKHHSSETKRKIAAGNKDKIISEETRLKMAQAQKGKVISIETRRKMSEISSKRTHSEETKKKMSEIHKGKIFSIETKKKMSEAAKRRITRTKLERSRGAV